MKRDLWVALLLQVADDALTNQITGPNDLQYLVVVLPDESQLEAILCWVNGDGPGTSGAVKTVNGLTLDAGEVDRLLESLDDAVVTIWESVLDVVERGVDEDAAVVPSGRLDADGLVDQSAVAESLVRNGDG